VSDIPKTYHLDRRAEQIAAQPADENMRAPELARYLGVSKAFLDVARIRGGGPPFVRLGRRCVIYRKADVVRWLEERAAASRKKAKP